MAEAALFVASGLVTVLGQTSATLDAARAHGIPGLPWLTLAVLGSLSAGMLAVLHHTGSLSPERQVVTAASAPAAVAATAS